MTTALVVSRYFPYDTQRVHGLYQRLGTQIQALARVTSRVECLFLVSDDQHYTADALKAHEERLRQLWSPALALAIAPTADESVPASPWERIARGIYDFHTQLIVRSANNKASFEAVSQALDSRPDIVLSHRLSSMGVLMRIADQAPDKLRGIPVFFDMDDIEHISAFRRLVLDPSWPKERLLLLQLPRLLLAEIRAMRMSAGTFVCSEGDRRRLARFPGGKRVRAIPNSVTFPPQPAGDSSEPLVLLVGAMAYRPNAQAADSLVREIWPLVREQMPNAQLAICGPGREHTLSYHQPQEGVSFPGFVDDLLPWYRRARVVCCPIHHGGGTRVKIIEAAANAKAVVSTRVGAEGLEFTDGSEIILRDGAREIAAECIRLLGDSRAAATLGSAALRKARSIYDKGAVVDQLAGIFGAALAARAGA
jgi:glycosyltransferase involved in cell wall biosynthesis